MVTTPRLVLSVSRFLAVASLLSLTTTVEAQLFDNLQTFGNRLRVGPSVAPEGEYLRSGPKSIVSSDFDRSGTADFAVSSTDGTITIYYQRDDGEFDAPRVLSTQASTLRQIIAADLDNNGYEELVAASHTDGVLIILPNEAGVFGEPISKATWPFARNLAAGDFDGDGNVDLAVAGSGRSARAVGAPTSGGVVVYGGDGDFGLAIRESFPGLDAGGHTRPVYSLEARPSRAPGAENIDELVVTHAWAANLWILRHGQGTELEIAETIPLSEDVDPDRPDGDDFFNALNGVYYLDIAPIANESSSDIDDIVTVHRDSGSVDVRLATADGATFSRTVSQRLFIPGGPRAAKLIDLDSDGWNDLVVVVRNHDRVVTYRNVQGTFEPQFESPTGVSPRDLTIADFDGDGREDAAVINRRSNDVSLLKTFESSAGFQSFDQIYVVDGDVASLDIGDLNGDRRDDVVQLHRVTGDISVRLALEDGRLAPPSYYRMGVAPTGIHLVDINHDGHLDAITATLGNRNTVFGTLGLRLGNADGTFGDLIEFDPGTEGQLFGLEVADFDGDGRIDVAAGFIDCRVVFFRGTEQGAFVPTPASFLVYEPQAMCSGDLDGDGDPDIVAASWGGDLVVVENRGNLFDNPADSRTEYPAPEIVRTSTLACVDADNDGDADLVIGSDRGTVVYESDGNFGFRRSDISLAGTGFAVSQLTTADLDGDGDPEIIVSCLVLSCITILTRGEDGKYGPALTVDVPSAEFVGAGDLDGDGQADLVGTGEVLWTALSSRRPEPSAPSESDNERSSASAVVINELLALNEGFAFTESLGRTSDFVELYNGSEAAVDLAGWMLGRTSETPDGPRPRAYLFPPASIIGPGEHLLLLLDRNDAIDYPHRVDWRIPGTGGTLVLLDRAGEPVDQVVYPPQFPDISYARFRDGISAFAYNPSPSPGRPNLDNGTVEPTIELLNFGPSDQTLEAASRPLIGGQPIRIFASAQDETAIINVSIVYRHSTDPRGTPQRAILFDDGAHEDGEFQDGLFSATIPGVPAGTGLEFYLETEDVQGNTTRAPGDAEILAGRESLDVYRSIAPTSSPQLELSEFVASNRTGILDESGSPADWVEIQNCSGTAVSLDGVIIADSLTRPSKWYRFPAGIQLESGEQILVFCDSDPEEGPFHAPFDLEASGESLLLLHEDDRGFPAIIDSVSFGEQQNDLALARPECGGEWRFAEPTPGGDTKVVTARLGDVDRNGRLEITDTVAVLGFLFQGGRLVCPPAANANSDARVDISDALFVLNYLFVGGPAPQDRQVSCEAAE